VCATTQPEVAQTQLVVAESQLVVRTQRDADAEQSVPATHQRLDQGLNEDITEAPRTLPIVRTDQDTGRLSTSARLLVSGLKSRAQLGAAPRCAGPHADAPLAAVEAWLAKFAPNLAPRTIAELGALTARWAERALDEADTCEPLPICDGTTPQAAASSSESDSHALAIQDVPAANAELFMSSQADSIGLRQTHTQTSMAEERQADVEPAK
jgi:hypothetical protein